MLILKDEYTGMFISGVDSQGKIHYIDYSSEVKTFRDRGHAINYMKDKWGEWSSFFKFFELIPPLESLDARDAEDQL